MKSGRVDRGLRLVERVARARPRALWVATGHGEEASNAERVSDVRIGKARPGNVILMYALIVF